MCVEKLLKTVKLCDWLLEFEKGIEYYLRERDSERDKSKSFKYVQSVVFRVSILTV